MRAPLTASASPKNLNECQQFSPKRQEWALINQYKALQYERLKQKQRQIAHQKKNNFKRQLDHQMSSKNNVQQEQIEADRKYYDFITKQVHKLKQKQQTQKMSRIVKRKNIQQENSLYLETTRNSRIRDQDTGYHLKIGHKSEQEKRRNSQNMKRNVLNTLDQQLKQKYEDKSRSKLNQMQADIKNLEYQNNYHDHRSQKHRHFGQNQRVYQYYKQLQRQKTMKDMELQYRIVEQGAQRKRMLEDQRIRDQQLKKMMIKEQVKQTLDHQVKVHNMKMFEQKKVNPEDYTYGVIGNVFRQRNASYDKNKYIEELRAQAQQQKRRKKMQNFMSEQEYRLNMNQLSKVVNGEYAHNSYLDRSLGTIGDNKQLRLVDISESINDKDAQAVKYRLNNIRLRNNSQIASKTDRSF